MSTVCVYGDIFPWVSLLPMASCIPRDVTLKMGMGGREPRTKLSLPSPGLGTSVRIMIIYLWAQYESEDENCLSELNLNLVKFSLLWNYWRYRNLFWFGLGSSWHHCCRKAVVSVTRLERVFCGPGDSFIFSEEFVCEISPINALFLFSDYRMQMAKSEMKTLLLTPHSPKWWKVLR